MNLILKSRLPCTWTKLDVLQRPRGRKILPVHDSVVENWWAVPDSSVSRYSDIMGLPLQSGRLRPLRLHRLLSMCRINNPVLPALVLKLLMPTLSNLKVKSIITRDINIITGCCNGCAIRYAQSFFAYLTVLPEIGRKSGCGPN